MASAGLADFDAVEDALELQLVVQRTQQRIVPFQERPVGKAAGHCWIEVSGSGVHQVFSGTVLGQGPVLLHDNEFRFDVDLGTGQTTGIVFLENRIAGQDIRCHLDVAGNGAMDENGDALVDYTGRCRIRLVPGMPEQARRKDS